MYVFRTLHFLPSLWNSSYEQEQVSMVIMAWIIHIAHARAKQSYDMLHRSRTQTKCWYTRRVKEVWNNADGTTIFDLKRSPCRVYPFELYLNLFLMCAWLCFYFLSLFYVLLVARAFSYFLFARACIIVMYIQLTVDAYFILTLIILFSLPILTFVQ